MLGGRNNGNSGARTMYSFPELRIAEILQCMGDLRIPLSEAELTKPTTSIVQRIFESFADIFMGISKEQLGQQPTFQVVETLEHPDLHLDSINMVAFYRLMLRLMIEVGIEDFSLRDLIKPEAPRLRLILSAVINFAKFREEQLAVFEEFSRRGEEAGEQRTKLSKRHEELSVRIAHVKSKHRDEEPATLQLKDEMTRMIQVLRDLKKEQTALSAELDAYKSRKGEASERMAQTQFLLGNVKQECNKLKSRIVHSPEKLLQIIAEMNASITSEKSNVSQLEKRSRELQMKLEALAQLEQELLRTLQGMESLNSDLRKRDELLTKVQEERDSIERQQILAKDLSIKETQMSRQLNAAQDKVSRLQRGQQERREKMGTRLKTLQEEYQIVAENRSRAASKIEQSDKLVKDFEARMGELRQSHETEVATMRTECVALKARVASYTNEMKKHLIL
jgi:kinetochore protein Nuf2